MTAPPMSSAICSRLLETLLLRGAEKMKLSDVNENENDDGAEDDDDEDGAGDDSPDEVK